MAKTGSPRKVFKKRDKEFGGDRKVLFVMEGDDGVEVEYTIPSKVSAGFALTAMRYIAENGEQSGSYFILKELLSAGGYQALEDADMDQEDLEGIFKELQDVVFGNVPKDSKS